MPAQRRILILGGARSGKSAYAESLMPAHGDKLYIATAHAGDAEMAARIEAHQLRRGTDWKTLEAPYDLAATIRAHAAADTHMLVDCVTLWLSNLVLAGHEVENAVDELLDTIEKVEGTLALVSNEVGMGIVPDNALARRFRDAAGRANQRLAAAADEVVFITAGLPLVLKQTE